METLKQICLAILLTFAIVPLGGCFCFGLHPKVTAVPLSPWNAHEKAGIPFYLPKPLLIVSKNFRNIEEVKTGLTDSAPIPDQFDDQAKYADVNARTNFTVVESTSAGTAGTTPSAAQPTGGTASKSAPRIFSDNGAPLTPNKAPLDDLSPETFYTYHIVFVPDLTQKYGLRIRGGVGEIRAAMNLVNGWQFTGLGPFYMKDSSTAQNILSTGIAANLTGRGVADVVNSVADLTGALQTNGGQIPAGAPEVQRFTDTIHGLDLSRAEPLTLCNFAEIHVYEPFLTPDGMMEWREIVTLNFDREVLGMRTTQPMPEVVPPGTETTSGPALQASNGGGLQTGAYDAGMIKGLLAQHYGVSTDAFMIPDESGGQLQAGGLSSGGLGQLNVNQQCGTANGCPHREFNLIKCDGDCWLKRDQPKVVNRRIVGVPALAQQLQAPSGTDTGSEPATNRAVPEPNDQPADETRPANGVDVPPGPDTVRPLPSESDAVPSALELPDPNTELDSASSSSRLREKLGNVLDANPFRG